MRYLKYLYLAVGLALLIAVIARVDLAEGAKLALQVGWSGMALLLALYFVAFTSDTVVWQLTLDGMPLTLRWAYRAWKIRMVGEVFNTVIPAAGLGGEPMKAQLLKSHYGIGYRAGLTSLILTKTTILLALVLFLAVGFALMRANDALGDSYKLVATIGLAAFSLAIILFFMVQRWRGASFAGTRLARLSFARRIEDILHHVRDMDDRLVEFYARNTSRFVAAFALAFLAWVLGVAEIYFAMDFLGHPVSFTEAWIIEAATQLVTNGAFFIPGSIGVQEGAFFVVCTAITGAPSAGVAMAVVRRFRELLWLLWGAAMGLFVVRRSPGGGDAST